MYLNLIDFEFIKIFYFLLIGILVILKVKFIRILLCIDSVYINNFVFLLKCKLS